jgi:predicted nicotinamide N-methyase
LYETASRIDVVRDHRSASKKNHPQLAPPSTYLLVLDGAGLHPVGPSRTRNLAASTLLLPSRWLSLIGNSRTSVVWRGGICGLRRWRREKKDLPDLSMRSGRSAAAAAGPLQLFVILLSLILATTALTLVLPGHRKKPWDRQEASSLRRPSLLHSSSAEVVRISGLDCRPVSIRFSEFGTITVLEATAQSQDALVHLAVRYDEGEKEEGDDDDPSNERAKVTNGDVYGSVVWPAASGMASYLLKRNLVVDKSILELGAGTGLLTLACLELGRASSAVATDYEELPLLLLRRAVAADSGSRRWNRRLSAAVGDTADPVLRTRILDIADLEDPLPLADVVVAADVLYNVATSKALAHRAAEALGRGSRFIVGDSLPGRIGRPAFVRELSGLGVKGVEFREVRGGWTTSSTSKRSKEPSGSFQEPAIAVLDLDPATRSLL